MTHPLPSFSTSDLREPSRRSAQRRILSLPAITPYRHILLLPLRILLRRSTRLEALLKIRNDIIDMFRAHADPNQILRHPGPPLLIITQLLMRCRPGVYRQRLRVAHIRQIADQLEPIHDLLPSLLPALDTKAQHAAKAAREVFLRQRVALMRFQPRIAHPHDMVVFLQPLGERQRVGGMALTAQREGLHPQHQLLRREGVQRRA